MSQRIAMSKLREIVEKAKRHTDNNAKSSGHQGDAKKKTHKAGEFLDIVLFAFYLFQLPKFAPCFIQDIVLEELSFELGFELIPHSFCWRHSVYNPSCQ